MKRVLVVGMSGAGKTTAARRIATSLEAPFHEMDVLAIGPGWSTPPDLEEQVAAIVAGPTWVFDSWGYEPVRDALWARADTIVWLDYPRSVVWVRLLRRSLRRSWTREPLFGGNRERWRDWVSPRHPLWHAVATFRQRRAYLAHRTAATEHVITVRLASPAAYDAWVAGPMTFRPGAGQ